MVHPQRPANLDLLEPKLPLLVAGANLKTWLNLGEAGLRLLPELTSMTLGTFHAGLAFPLCNFCCGLISLPALQVNVSLPLPPQASLSLGLSLVHVTCAME